MSFTLRSLLEDSGHNSTRNRSNNNHDEITDADLNDSLHGADKSNLLALSTSPSSSLVKIISRKTTQLLTDSKQAPHHLIPYAEWQVIFLNDPQGQLVLYNNQASKVVAKRFPKGFLSNDDEDHSGMRNHRGHRGNESRCAACGNFYLIKQQIAGTDESLRSTSNAGSFSR